MLYASHAMHKNTHITQHTSLPPVKCHFWRDIVYPTSSVYFIKCSWRKQVKLFLFLKGSRFLSPRMCEPHKSIREKILKRKVRTLKSELIFLSTLHFYATAVLFSTKSEVPTPYDYYYEEVRNVGLVWIFDDQNGETLYTK